MKSYRSRAGLKNNCACALTYGKKRRLRRTSFKRNRSLLQRVQRVMVCEWWLVVFDPLGIFLCFKDRCFWTSEFACFHVFGLLALEFFTFLLKHGKLRFPRWNCSYRASKSSRNTDMGGRKRIDTSPPTLNFAASSRYYVLYLTGKDWKLW